MTSIKIDNSKIEIRLSNALKVRALKASQMNKNRNNLKYIIDTTYFLASQGLPFKNDENDDKGPFLELVNLLKGNNPLEMIRYVSVDVQNNIIDSMAESVNAEISKELHKASFVSVIMGIVDDLSDKLRLSTVLRFVSSNGVVCERFVTFTDWNEDRSAAALAAHLFTCLDKFNCKNKLIAQTYDGYAIRNGQHNGLLKLLAMKYPSAIFVHCYAHTVNLILKQSIEDIGACKSFFRTIIDFTRFLFKASKRTNLLENVIKGRIVSASHTTWLCESGLIELATNNKMKLQELLQSVISDTDKWNRETRERAREFDSIFRQFDFNFMLNIFSLLFTKSTALFKTLQEETLNIAYCLKKISQFQNEINIMLQYQFEEIWSKTMTCDSTFEKKRRSDDDMKQWYHCLFGKIMYKISRQFADRYADFEKLEFLSLLDYEKFGRYSNNFPDSAFTSLTRNYGDYFDFTRLKMELSIIYSSEVYRNLPAFKLIKYLIANKLNEAFPEALKLLNLILTIPAVSHGFEDASLSSLKKIQTYLKLRLSRPQDEPPALTLIAVENRLVKNMMQREMFYNTVINTCAQKSATYNDASSSIKIQ